MPILDITKPEIIRFLNECYEKTAKARLQWLSKHSDKLKEAATLTREAKDHFEQDVLKAGIETFMPTISKDYVSSGRNRRRKAVFNGHIPTTADLIKGHSIVEMGLGDPKEDPRLARPDSSLTKDPIMRPVDKNQKAILYKNQPSFGRKAYLRSRNKMQPEDKFYFQECTTWTHGWRFKDSAFGKNAPSRPRVMHLTKGTRTRTGPQPDPIHYKSPDKPMPTTCL